MLLLLLLLQRELIPAPWEAELEQKLQAVQQEVEALSHVLQQQQQQQEQQQRLATAATENVAPAVNVQQQQQQQQQQRKDALGEAPPHHKDTSSSSSCVTNIAATLQQEIDELLQSSLYTPDDPLIKALEDARLQAPT